MPDSIKVEASQWGKAPTVESVYYYLSQDFLFIYLHLDYSDPNLNKWPEVSPQGLGRINTLPTGPSISNPYISVAGQALG